jgi:hypothetical protein
MNIIHVKRESIITDNNTAQYEFSNIIRNLNTNISELNIKTPLHGALDLSVLYEKGFNNIKTIVFGEGEITNIYHVPQGINKLICAKNLLVELEELPTSITYLDCDHNYLVSFDFSKLSMLEEFHCVDNKIEELKNIPRSIISLYCDQNKLRHLDLKNLVNLKTLHVSNNPLIIIENLPDTVHEFVSENNPIEMAIVENEGQISQEDVNKTKKQIEKKINYIEALDRFFKLKSKYENDLNRAKHKEFKKYENKKTASKKAALVKPKCINCHRPVGSIFSCSSSGYSAICGDKNQPCQLNIILSRGYSKPIEDLVNFFKESIDDTKTEIIQQKMNTLFSYISEDQSAQIFAKKIKEYNNDSKIFANNLSIYNDLYNNSHKVEMIQKKNATIHDIHKKIRTMIDEYKNTEHKETLRTAIDVYIRDLIPEIDNLRRLKYEINEMIVDDDGNDALYQREVALSKMEYTYGEHPSVSKFKIN